MYIVKFITNTKDIFTVSPAMEIFEAQRILRDLKLMSLTAWLEKVNNEI
jgi:hypothetical protein